MQIREALTFDDVLLVPAASTVLPSTADVTTHVTRVGGASVALQQSLVHPNTTTALCDTTLRIGWVDAQRLQPARMPSILMEALQP